MKALEDNFGEKISLGDAILYAVKKSTSVKQHYAFVYGIEKRGNTFILKVVAAKKHYSWDGNISNYSPYRYYKTTLTANNFTKIPMSAVHESVREELLKRLP
jgi:hypothetical protein